MRFPDVDLRMVMGVALLALTPLIPLEQGWRYWQLASDGLTAPARIAKLEKQRRRKAWLASHYAIYEFADENGRTRTGRQRISYDLYEVLSASKPDRDIVIRYCRSRPSLSVISLDRVRNEFLLFTAIAAVAWTIIFVLFVQQRRERPGIVEAIRQRMLYDNARRAPRRPGPGPSIPR
jgi:hypothetical protein